VLRETTEYDNQNEHLAELTTVSTLSFRLSFVRRMTVFVKSLRGARWNYVSTTVHS